MLQTDFTFKQFSICAGDAGMPVSTDSVMLGAWANIDHSKHILDIGTGTGLLALMCAQRNLNAKITAIDLDELAFKTASYNIMQSKWHERIKVIHCDILTYPHKALYEHIICNPPYFNEGETSKNKQRAIARHSHSLPHLSLLIQCQSLLAPFGRASFILPLIEGEAFIKLALNNGWFLSRLCNIKATENKKSKRILLELTQDEVKTIQTEIIIHDKSNRLGYSDDFINLCQDFYIKM